MPILQAKKVKPNKPNEGGFAGSKKGLPLLLKIKKKRLMDYGQNALNAAIHAPLQS
jgi:hypothetical protein